MVNIEILIRPIYFRGLLEENITGIIYKEEGPNNCILIESNCSPGQLDFYLPETGAKALKGTRSISLLKP